MKNCCNSKELEGHTYIKEKCIKILDGLIGGVYQKNLKGNLTFVNDTFCRILGYKESEILGKSFKILLFKEDIQKAECFVKNVLSGKCIKEAIRIKHKDGHEVFVRFNGIPLKEKGKIIGSLGNLINITPEKKAIEFLKESEARYHSFIEVTGQLGWTTNPSGLVAEDIPSWRRFTGQSYKQVKGYGWINSIHPDDIKRTKQTWENAVKTKGIYEVEYRVRRHDGIYRWFLARGIPVFGKQNKILEWVGTCIDITEKKKAEETLKESEEKHRALIETTDTGYVIIDNTGKVLDANQRYVRLAGHKKLSDILGKSVMKWTAKSDQEKNLEAVKKCFEQGFIRGLEINYVGKSGKFTPIEINATVIQSGEGSIVVTLCRDITERKKVENALKESEEKYMGLFNNAVDAIFVADPITRKVTDCNKAAEKLMGYSREKLISMKADELHSKELRKETMEGFKKQAAGKIKTIFSDVLTKDNKRIPIEISASGINIRKKHYIQAIFRDITERKKIKEKIKEEQEKYQNLFDNAVDAIFIADPATRQIVNCNKTAEKLMGYSKAQLLFMKADELHPKDIAKETMEGFKKQAEGKIKIIFSEALTKDNKRIPLSINAAIIKIGDKNYMQAIFRDITEQKKAEKEMKEFNEFAVGRELKMVELKKEINELLKELGKKAKYNTDFSGGGGRWKKK